MKGIAAGAFIGGTNSFTWNGKDTSGNATARGAYLCTFRAQDIVISSRMTLIK